MAETVESFGKAEFRRSLRGYTPAEVDKYVKTLTEAYSALYRENAELEKKLADAEDKIAELQKIKETLEQAKKKSNDIVHDAYENADGILFSIKTSCDEILRGFRKKVEEQKALLYQTKKSVELFQHELFEKYKVHVELIEQLIPKAPTEEILSADDYVERVVSNLKREISAEYGVTIDKIVPPEKKLVTVEKAAKITKDIEETVPDPAPVGDEKYMFVENDTENVVARRVPTVIEMLSEYEKKQAQKIDNDGVQLALDIEAGTSKPSEN